MGKVKKLIVKAKPEKRRKKSEKFINLKSSEEKVVCFDSTHWTFRWQPRWEIEKMLKKLSCRLIRLNPEKILQINPHNTRRIPFCTNRKHFHWPPFDDFVTCSLYNESVSPPESRCFPLETNGKSVKPDTINIKFNDLLRRLQGKVMRLVRLQGESRNGKLKFMKLKGLRPLGRAKASAERNPFDLELKVKIESELFYYRPNWNWHDDIGES